MFNSNVSLKSNFKPTSGRIHTNCRAPKLLFETLIFFFVTLFASCAYDSDTSWNEELARRGELVVAAGPDMPDNSAVTDRYYDILKQYADRLGVTLRIVEGLSRAECEEMLRTGEADAVAGLSSYESSESVVTPIYKTSYVLLAGPGIDPRSSDFTGRRILIASGFKASRSYDAAMDSLFAAYKFISDARGNELLRSLRRGEYDYLICTGSDARIVLGPRSKIGLAYDFRDETHIAITLSTNEIGLSTGFSEWLAQSDIDNAPISSGGIISDYDDILRDAAAKQGLDWRLLSAIAYQESRFRPQSVSNKGALGLMQIMPAVARQFGVSCDEITDPRTNVMIAARLLKKIENSLKLPASTPRNDRMSIVLACYNAGVGHIADARRLAKKYGANPNRWADVSTYLDLKSQPEYYNDEVVRNGIFCGSWQTEGFVDGVMRKYNSYCLIAQR